MTGCHLDVAARSRSFFLERTTEKVTLMRGDEEIPPPPPTPSPLTPILVLKVDTIEDTSRTLLSILRIDFGRTASLLIFALITSVHTVTHDFDRHRYVMSRKKKMKHDCEDKERVTRNA